ncbi:substrate-binding domain-containing protein [Actinoplanes sp. KI2]|nr:substrate-binding domain-containing protein [Actinoplanes sp. KI2]
MQIGYLADRGHARIALATPADPPSGEARLRVANRAAAAGAASVDPAPGEARLRVANRAASVDPAPGEARLRVANRAASADPAPGEARLRVANRAAAARGIEPLRTVEVPRPRSAAAAAIAAFRAAHPEVTAIAGYDDDTALRVLTALHDLGVPVPGELAVMGFDDTEYGALATPSLTTVHIDAEAHGRLAARQALGQDLDGLAPTHGEIVARESA